LALALLRCGPHVTAATTSSSSTYGRAMSSAPVGILHVEPLRPGLLGEG
jgi:hypothetical protein